MFLFFTKSDLFTHLPKFHFMVRNAFQKLSFLMLALFTGTLSFAQDAKKLDVDIDVNKGGDAAGAGFLSNPVVWVIGAAVFILLLVALMRGNKRSA